MQSSPQFGIYLLPVNLEWTDLRRMVIEAEDSGFDFLWMHDNVVGPIPWKSELPVFDAWSVLGALGEATSRIRLGPLVTPMGRRHPSLFAKMAASFDITSGGRLDLGMGPGDEAHHFEPWGMRYPERPGERIAILQEELEVITRLWASDHVTFEGEHYHLSSATVLPKPVQSPHPPIWIGLISGRKVMPRVAAKWADGVNFYARDDDDVAETLALVRRLRSELGRDPSTLMCSRNLSVWVTEDGSEPDIDAEMERLARSFDQTREHIEKYAMGMERLIVGPPDHVADEIVRQIDLGIDHPIFSYLLGPGPAFSDLTPADGIVASMQRISTEVLPLVRSILGSRANVSPV